MARAPEPAKRRWLIPLIVVVATAVVVGGLIVAVAVGGRIF